MASYNPTSTSLAQEMPVTIDGKNKTKTSTINNIRHDLSAAHALEFANAVAELKEFPVSANKKKNTSLIVE